MVEAMTRPLTRLDDPAAAHKHATVLTMARPRHPTRLVNRPAACTARSPCAGPAAAHHAQALPARARPARTGPAQRARPARTASPARARGQHVEARCTPRARPSHVHDQAMPSTPLQPSQPSHGHAAQHKDLATNTKAATACIPCGVHAIMLRVWSSPHRR